jgi:hypothetical protein
MLLYLIVRILELFIEEIDAAISLTSSPHFLRHASLKLGKCYHVYMVTFKGISTMYMGICFQSATWWTKTNGLSKLGVPNICVLPCKVDIKSSDPQRGERNQTPRQNQHSKHMRFISKSEHPELRSAAWRTKPNL